MANNGKAKPSELLDRTPPHSLEAERAVLGSILLVPALMDEVGAILSRHDFYAEPHRTIFKHLVQIHKDGVEIDENLLSERLRAADEFEAIGGRPYLFELVDAVATPATATELARAVREDSTRRELIFAAIGLLKGAHNPRVDPEELATEAKQIGRICDDPAIRRRKIGVMNSADFEGAQFEMNYLIEHIAVTGQNMVVGGVGKVLKTLICGVDMGISIASGSPFLGQFRVPARQRVAFLSGESGEFKLQDVARRVCATKEISLRDDVDMLWGWDLPQLAKPDDLDALGRMVRETGTKVLMIDPLYLCLLGGDVQKRQASNIFDMGSLLSELTALAREHQITMCLMHHCAKHSADLSKPPDLKDLAFAGFAEWARQWILLGRRADYLDGSGRHELWMRSGGSAGHGGLWGVDVEEGQVDAHLRGEKWLVDVSSGATARDEARQKKASQVSKKAMEDIDIRVEKLRKSFRAYPQGDTEKILREGAGLNPKAFEGALEVLRQRGEIEEILVVKKRGRFPGWRPTEHLRGLDDERPLLAGTSPEGGTTSDSSGFEGE